MNATTARVTVDLEHPGDTISRHLYGHFAEHLGRGIYGGFWVGEDSDIPNVRGLRTDVVDALRALGIPNLRWPGGCFADEYHWRDGIGARVDRPRMANSNWGDVVEDNAFGTHEFMDLCELLGAEAYVNGNVGSGTVREMSEWVEYLTRSDDSAMARLRRAHGRDEPWQVTFWGLGNEAWGCGGNMRPEYYAQEAARYATFCRQHGERALIRVAAGAPDDDVRWTRALMEVAMRVHGPFPTDPPVFEALSFHYYTHSGSGIQSESATSFSREQYTGTIARAADVERILRAHEEVMDEYDPDRAIALVCDEWGTWWQSEPGTDPGFLFQQNTMRDALVAGIHFDAFHRHAGRLRMANIAQTLNVLQAMILTDDEGIVLTPTYHVYEMNRGHHDASALPTSVLSAPLLDGAGPALCASSSRSGDQVLVSLTHTGLDAPLEVDVDLGVTAVSVRRARVLTAPDASSHNTPDAPRAVFPHPLAATLEDGVLRLVMPPHSFATVEVEVG